VPEIFLCQPDNQKGCSVCCGLFNLQDISKKNLSAFLKTEEKSKFLKTVRDLTTYSCLSQKFIKENKPGCSLVPEKENGKNFRSFSFYGEKICADFYCPAYSILNSKEQFFLVSCLDDWYLYSIAILDPESFIWIIKKITAKISFDSNLLKPILAVILDLHAKFLQRIKGPLFFFSCSEYNFHKEKFSLLAGSSPQINKHKKNILSQMNFLTSN